MKYEPVLTPHVREQNAFSLDFYTSRARGYEATLVSGIVTMREGEQTGALPGRLIRGPQSA